MRECLAERERNRGISERIREKQRAITRKRRENEIKKAPIDGVKRERIECKWDTGNRHERGDADEGASIA